MYRRIPNLVKHTTIFAKYLFPSKNDFTNSDITWFCLGIIHLVRTENIQKNKQLLPPGIHKYVYLDMKW